MDLALNRAAPRALAPKAWRRGLVGLLALVALGACQRTEVAPRLPAELTPGPHFKIGSAYEILGATYRPGFANAYRAEGIASWYGHSYHGRPTANGEIYDVDALTAAHPTLPLPSYVEVTNLENGRDLVVRVNDRGPFIKNRVIDLSLAAARRLGFEEAGLARVRVRYLGLAPVDEPPIKENEARVYQPRDCRLHLPEAMSCAETPMLAAAPQTGAPAAGPEAAAPGRDAQVASLVP